MPLPRPACLRRALALACLSASGACMAQAGSVQLYGVLDLSATSRQLAGNPRTKEVANGALTTSFIGLRGNEDLGGGYGAVFGLESFLRADTGEAGRTSTDPFWARNAWVGLSTPAGLLRLGRQSTPGFLLGGRTNPFGNATGIGPMMLHTYMPSATQPMITGNGTADSAWSNAVGFASRDLGGVTVALVGAAGEGGTAERRGAAALNYQRGALVAGLSLEKMERMALPWGAPAPVLATTARPLFTAQQVQTLLAGVAYDFGPAKGYAQWYRAELESASAATIKLHTWQLGTSVRAGEGDVLASWVRTAKEQPGVADQHRDTVTVAYDYRLSKRTDVYLALMRDKVTGLDRGNTSTLGLRHAF
jgi:predicted porin